MQGETLKIPLNSFGILNSGAKCGKLLLSSVLMLQLLNCGASRGLLKQGLGNSQRTQDCLVSGIKLFLGFKQQAEPYGYKKVQFAPCPHHSWELNQGHHTWQARALPLSYTPKPKAGTICLCLRQGLVIYFSTVLNSRCSPGRPQTHGKCPASVSLVLALQVCAIIPIWGQGCYIHINHLQLCYGYLHEKNSKPKIYNK